LAAPAAAVAAAVVVEPPVLAVVDLAHPPVLALAQVVARLVHRVPLPLLARLPVLAKAHLPVPERRSVVVGLVAHLVVEPAVPLQLLLSRQSFSAAMASSSP
jgi:hypothetical protein